jgi:hypothetical protein
MGLCALKLLNEQPVSVGLPCHLEKIDGQNLLGVACCESRLKFNYCFFSKYSNGSFEKTS